jgi:hypothetical protein
VDLTLDLFAPLVGDAFVIRAADGAIEAELVDAVAATHPGDPAAQRDPFSLTFRGPEAPALQQGIHEVVHPALEPVTLFLVPLGPADGGPQYQAVFG